MTCKNISLLGATGSIGSSTIDIVERFPQKFKLVALAARQNITKLAAIANRHKVPVLAIFDQQLVDELAALLDYDATIYSGADGVLQCARLSEADIVVGSLVGIAGLESTLAAINADKYLALANKESLVAGGELVEAALKAHPKARLVPVDSEHSAIFQCLNGCQPEMVKRLLLTASGGPFRGWKVDQLAAVTPEMALKHPNWSMGAKVTIDSATMMNKALEVIEAYWLFKMPPEKIEVLIHPKSLVHSMVELIDGQTLAQMGPPDMRLPISYALFYPERAPMWQTVNPPVLDWTKMPPVEFFGLDQAPLPSVNLAKQALAAGGSATTALNGADEVAVAAFLSGRISFTAIYDVVKTVLDKHQPTKMTDYASVLNVDRQSRAVAQSLVDKY